MMVVAVHDSGRSGKVGWFEQAVGECGVSRVILSPFETPLVGQARRPSGAECVAAVRAAGAEVFFDPTTHALCDRSNYFKYYDTWGLWPGKGPSSDEPALLEHVKRVLGVQSSLQVPLVAPTIRLQEPLGPRADLAMAMATRAADLAPGASVAICGSPAFWSAGPALDVFVGEIAVLQPKEVFLTTSYDIEAYPAPITATAVEGLCRSVHSLGLRSRVTVAHGDLAALPAVAAGAAHVGSGWDLGQRRFSAESTVVSTEMARSSIRVTHQRLLAVLKAKEAEELAKANAQLSRQLVPGALPPDSNTAWKGHLKALVELASTLASVPDRARRVSTLQGFYIQAAVAFGQVTKHTRLAAGANDWLTPVSKGLSDYATAEGL